MKLDRLFKLGKQGYDMYRSYKGKGRGHNSYGSSSSKYAKSSEYGGGSTLERLIRRFLK